MAIGQVIRAHGGILYVWVEGQLVECRSRGRLRHTSQEVLAGDWVEVTCTDPGEGRIEAVQERRSMLVRPAVANVDQVLAVCTLRDPPADLRLLDRLLVHVASAGLPVVVVLNKVDISPPEEVAALAAAYRPVGYPFHAVSALTGAGLAELLPHLAERVSVLAGQSGVGKSRLAGVLVDRQVRVGELSSRPGRGRHTTRHVELLPLPTGGFLADAPGFTNLEFAGLTVTDLADCFPELGGVPGSCRFADCSHAAEPDCAVKAAVAAGDVAEHRYAHYLEFRSEIAAMRKW